MADTLLIGAGGTLAYGLLGALSHLDAIERTSQVRRFVGVSVGAIIACLLCAGIDIKIIVRTFFRSDFSKLQSISPVTMLGSYGLDSGSRLIGKITEVFCESGLSRSITLAQLRQRTGRDLAVGVCDILARKFVFLSADSHPDVQVLEAVRASFAIPFVYSPQTIQDRIYVDGAIMSSFPIGQCIHQWPESTFIGIRVSQLGSHKRKIDGILDYIQTVFSCVGSPSDWESYVHKSEKFREVSIELDAASMLASPSENEKFRMFSAGFDASLAAFPLPADGGDSITKDPSTDN